MNVSSHATGPLYGPEAKTYLQDCEARHYLSTMTDGEITAMLATVKARQGEARADFIREGLHRNYRAVRQTRETA